MNVTDLRAFLNAGYEIGTKSESGKDFVGVVINSGMAGAAVGD